MKILILGGTGAIGSSVVKILSERGHDVIVTSRKQRLDNNRIKYILGDAHDQSFLTHLLRNNYDTILDFMIYSPDEFKQKKSLFLSKTAQYIFVSSARVFADSNFPITEDSPRLLDVIIDRKYLSLDEYALAKAREENFLFLSENKNWTIVRPYITYFDERLQLGVYEKEYWLQRAISGQEIIFSKSLSEKYTTLTYGYDVSLRIADLIGNKNALTEAFNITTDEKIKWKDVLKIYLTSLNKIFGITPKICYTDNIDKYSEKYNYYQVYYDRMYNRVFDNSKIQTITNESSPYVKTDVGLVRCMNNFFNLGGKFLGCNGIRLATMDRITHEISNLNKMPGKKNKFDYLIYRFVKKL